MAQPRVTKIALDAGDQPNKVVTLDLNDRLPDADAEFLRTFLGSAVQNIITSPASLPAANVSGSISGFTTSIPSANISGAVPNADVTQNVSWANLTNKPTTVSGLGISEDTNSGDAVTVGYVQDNIYKNLEPKVGKGVSKYVPVSSKFKYSWLEDAGINIINEYDQEVSYFIASDGKSQPEMFKATKYSTETEWAFVPEPIRPPSLAPDEYITDVFTGTEEFMRVNIYNSALATNTAALFYMNNKDDYNTWTRYDLPVSPTQYATFLPSQNRIVDCYPSGTITYVKVYDLTTGAQVGTTQTLYNISHGASDIDYSHSSVSMTSTSVRFHVSYYNEEYNNLVIHHSVIGYYVNNTTGSRAYQIKSFGASYDVPQSFITSGTGTLTPLIPLSSWNFFSAPTIYNSSANFRWSYHNRTKTRLQTEKGFWTFNLFETAKRVETGQITSFSEIYNTQNGVVYVPDSSPWSKRISEVMVFNNNMALFQGLSNTYGYRYILAEYEVINDEITIIPGRWRLLDQKPAGSLASVLDLAIDPAFYGTFTGFRNLCVTFDGSNNQRIYHCPGSGQPIYEVTFDTVNLLINLTNTGLTFPSLPAGYGNFKQYGYDPKTGRFITSAEKTGENRYVRMLVYSGGTWYESAFINEAQANTSRSSYNGGQVGNAVPSNYSNIFVDVDGSYYINQTFGVVGGTAAAPFNQVVFNGSTFTVTTGGSVNPYSMSFLMSYGNTANNGNTPGYVCKNTYTQDIRIQNLSGGTTAANTFLTPNTIRKFYVVGSSGLAAYVGVQDVFVGGYWSKTPSQAVALPANTTTYIYAERSQVTGDLSITTYSSPVSNTFNRVRIASVTTDSANPVSQEVYEANETEIDWDKVQNRPYTPGEVGTYVLAKRNVAGNVARGATVAGSTLETTSIIYNDAGAVVASFPSAGGLTGTWRCMGTYTNITGGSEGATIWMRIS